MKLSTRYQAKGIIRVVRGSVKEITGKLSSNRTLGIRGKFERLAGAFQWKIGKAQGMFGL